jgi:disulfide oxidoreductase YuzD
MSQDTLSNFGDDWIPEIMDRLSFSEAEAREWLTTRRKRYYANRECVYRFVKAHNPKVAELENSGIYAERIQKLADKLKISIDVATAIVIQPEVTRLAALKLLAKHERQGTENSSRADIQQMLGVDVPIPQDVWDALEIDHV